MVLVQNLTPMMMVVVADGVLMSRSGASASAFETLDPPSFDRTYYNLAHSGKHSSHPAVKDIYFRMFKIATKLPAQTWAVQLDCVECLF